MEYKKKVYKDFLIVEDFVPHPEAVCSSVSKILFKSIQQTVLECSMIVFWAFAKIPDWSGVDYVCHLVSFGDFLPHHLNLSQGRGREMDWQ